jgi:hypothetical protein
MHTPASSSGDFSRGEKFTYSPRLKPPATLKKVKITLHEHDADKAGKHYDLRIGGAGDWAIRYFPQSPSETRLAVQQPTHPISYYSFEGDITEGYGKGSVKKVFEGYGDIHSWTNEKIDFTFNNKSYVLINTGNGKWIIKMKSAQIKVASPLNIKSVMDRLTFERAMESDGFSQAVESYRKGERSDLGKQDGARGMSLRATNPHNFEDTDPKKGLALHADITDDYFY